MNPLRAIVFTCLLYPLSSMAGEVADTGFTDSAGNGSQGTPAGVGMHENGGIATTAGFDQVERKRESGKAVTRVRIVLIAGQSNADGRAVSGDLPAALRTPRSDLDFYHKVEGKVATLTTLRPGLSESAGFGPEIVLGHRLADLYREEEGVRLAIIKYANGGTNLHTQWKAGGNATTSGDGAEYVVFQQTVTSGLAALAAAHPQATLDLQALVWMQGESDAVATHSAAYQANLAAFIADLRATYGATLPVIIGRLSSAQTNLNAAHLKAVRAAQAAVAAVDPLTGIVNTDDFGMKSDKLHFDAAGQQSLGSAFAEEAAYYSWMVRTFTREDIAAGLAEPDADRDGDGQSNRREFLAGSDPLAALPVFPPGSRKSSLWMIAKAL